MRRDAVLALAPERVLRRLAHASLAGLLIVPLFIWGSIWVDNRPLPNIRIAGVYVPRAGSLERFLTRRATLWGEESIVLQVGHHVFRPTRAQLGGALSTTDASRSIGALGRSANPLVALRAWWFARFGAGHSLSWAPRVDEAVLDRYVRGLQEQIDRPPVPGALDREGRMVDGLMGEVLDAETTKRSLRQAMARDLRALRVSTIITPPPTTLRSFEQPGQHTNILMVAHETEYRAGSARAVNIELAARKLDDAVIHPGERLSFNTVVGKRTQSRGFGPATELVRGEIVQGIGGGVCQVAGTLHAAAFFAGLLVDEYHAHSRLGQFAYLRPGLDTMVAWPDHVKDVRDTKDMIIRNPYPFPITVRSSASVLPSGAAIVRVELYGAARPFRVDYNFEEIARVPAIEIVRSDASLRPGERKVQQESLPGMTILRHRRIYMPDRVQQELVRITYPPTPRIVRSAPTRPG